MAGIARNSDTKRRASSDRSLLSPARRHFDYHPPTMSDFHALARQVLRLALLALGALPAPAADWPAGIPIEEFPISYWCGPMPEFATLER